MPPEQRPIVIFGVGQLADVARIYLEQAGHRIAAFTVDDGFADGPSHSGLPVLSWDRLEIHAPPDAVRLFCPISYRGLNGLRQARYLEGKAKGYAFASYIHPTCVNNAESIGDNCLILENNVLQPYCRIGENVVLWSGNHIGHHSVIGDHCFIASQVVVSGGVRIGPRSFLGVNATVGDNISIGEAAVVGASALVLRDLGDHAVVAARANDPSPVPSSRLRSL